MNNLDDKMLRMQCLNIVHEKYQHIPIELLIKSAYKLWNYIEYGVNNDDISAPKTLPSVVGLDVALKWMEEHTENKK